MKRDIRAKSGSALLEFILADIQELNGGPPGSQRITDREHLSR